MKKYTFLLLLFIACSPSGSKDTTATDSLALADTLDIPDLPDDEATSASDTSQLNKVYNERMKAFQLGSTLLRVTIKSTEYEAEVESNWYFDAAIKPKYFSQTWNAEGNAGIREFFIDNDAVTCMQEDDGYQKTIWCQSTGGKRSEPTGEGEQMSSTLLPETFGAESTERVNGFLTSLKQILKEGSIASEDEESLEIHLERDSEEGEEYKQILDVSIPRKVYVELKK